MKEIFYIGGSPCSGKSTVAEILAKEFQLYYFKVDDYLDEYLKKGAEKKKPMSMKFQSMTSDETWLTNPKEQMAWEFTYYHETYEFIKEQMEQLHTSQKIITEGAAYLPELMKQQGIDQNHYISITPTKEFQVENYRKRPWVPYILKDCSDQKKAFKNWMERDALFANEVRNQCKRYQYESIVIDGSKSVEMILKQVREHFRL